MDRVQEWFPKEKEKSSALSESLKMRDLRCKIKDLSEELLNLKRQRRADVEDHYYEMEHSWAAINSARRCAVSNFFLGIVCGVTLTAILMPLLQGLIFSLHL